MGKFDKPQRDVDEIYKESPRPWQQVTIERSIRRARNVKLHNEKQSSSSG